MRLLILAATSVLLAVPAQAADPALDAALVRGTHRATAAYLDTGMSLLKNLNSTCLREITPTIAREKSAECLALALTSVAVDELGTVRFRTPRLLNESAIVGQATKAFLKAGGRPEEVKTIRAKMPGMIFAAL